MESSKLFEHFISFSKDVGHIKTIHSKQHVFKCAKV